VPSSRFISLFPPFISARRAPQHTRSSHLASCSRVLTRRRGSGQPLLLGGRGDHHHSSCRLRPAAGCHPRAPVSLPGALPWNLALPPAAIADAIEKRALAVDVAASLAAIVAEARSDGARGRAPVPWQAGAIFSSYSHVVLCRPSSIHAGIIWVSYISGSRSSYPSKIQFN